MHILVTNDDGISSPGLAVLVRAALDRGHTVTVAAPAEEYSGASSSLSGEEIDGRIALVPADPPHMPEGVECVGVRAAPALIAFLASYGAFGPRPDMVLSGVNLGANTGKATLHSGTVGAVLTAASHGIPGIAVSVTSGAPQHWETALLVTRFALERWEGRACHEWILNLNVPDVAPERLRGLRPARLASFGAVQAQIGRGDEKHIAVTYSAETGPEEPDSDHHLLTHGWATATLLRAPVDDPHQDLRTVTPAELGIADPAADDAAAASPGSVTVDAATVMRRT
ncbi:5'/3'-nucleotidase SurE [Kocuria tytonicola]|uniref:5'/3'-nucleotidase SurE n=1 Tax=Kocuria tytonicola TaxID=2055946 RepID=UPI000EF881F2|nr:5'/3'-nucleotidase SurE [Kocuria tytonicola]RLZ03946.1 5'/3'-nucleotidase SurE [Kocuria tytonicola]